MKLFCELSLREKEDVVRLLKYFEENNIDYILGNKPSENDLRYHGDIEKNLMALGIKPMTRGYKALVEIFKNYDPQVKMGALNAQIAQKQGVSTQTICRGIQNAYRSVKRQNTEFYKQNFLGYEDLRTFIIRLIEISKI